MSNIEARNQAMQAWAAVQPKPTSLISYQSSGQVIAIGSAQALRLCDQFPDDIKINRIATQDGASRIEVSGYLGAFEINISDASGNVTRHQADALLDLHEQPLLRRDLPPPGYFHVIEAAWDTQALTEQLQDLRGEFEKPRYFQYDASICAHGVNGKIACRQCIDACPAEAIQSLVDRIEVNPYLCQGGGSCATVCPSGAIVYAYPSIRDQGKRLRGMLQAYYANGGEDALILFHAETSSPQALMQAQDSLLPMPVEELASVGMELCLSALAYGATQVVLLLDEQVPARSLDSLRQQLGWLQALLVGLGMNPDSVCASDKVSRIEPASRVEAAIYDMPDSKRDAIFQALDHLVANLRPGEGVVELPTPAPFGEALIDAGKCTLCMACVGACPGRALQDGSNRELPEVFFIESNCLQCGACVQTCPEDAIILAPRMVFDREIRNRSRALNSDSPFACIGCGKLFAPTSVIHKMQEKLKDHYMFNSTRALDRLKMCEDCRVVDIVEDPEALGGQFDPLGRFRQ